MKTKVDDPLPPARTGGEAGKRAKGLSLRQLYFCDLVVAGHSYASAYRIAYKKPKASPEDAGEHGWRVTQGLGVKSRIEELRKLSGHKALLTLNDRLEILAEIAQSKTSKPTDKTRAIEVYSRISGDEAPQRHEHAGPNGLPIPVAATTLVGRLPIRARIEALKAARAAAQQATP